jgi:hypothetical protein
LKASLPVTRAPRTDSFDNIDRLLEEPLRLPAVGERADGRWRTSGISTPASNAATGGADGVESSPAETSGHIPTSWAERPHLLLMAGSVVAGVALAVGLTGWILARNDPSPATAALPDVAAVSGPASLDRPRQPDVPDRGGVAESFEPDRLAGATGPAQDDAAASTDDETGDQQAADSVPRAEDGKKPVPSQPAGSIQASVDVVTAPREATPASPPRDDLSAFAQWLQDPISVRVTPGPPITSIAAPIPQPDVSSDPDLPSELQASRSPPPLVDVEARLAETVSGVQLQDTPLVDALRLVTQVSTIPIYLDPEALGRRNIRADLRVSLTVRDVTVRGLLDQILDDTDLGWAALDGSITVTTKPDSRGDLVTIRHDVADLSRGDPELTRAMGKWVTQLIAYGSWAGQSEPADNRKLPHCDAGQTVLVVTHRDTVHFQVLVFLEKLRIARGLPPRTRILKDRIAMGARSAACAPLQQTVSLRLWQDGSFDEIAAALGRQASVQILVDWPALYAAGWSPQDREKFFTERRALQDALADWLHPRGLTYRIVDSETLEITTPQAIAAVHDIEFYRLTDKVGPPVDVPSVTQQVVGLLGEATFQPQGDGAIAYDEASRTLIVSLPQSQQNVVWQAIRQMQPAVDAQLDP